MYIAKIGVSGSFGGAFLLKALMTAEPILYCIIYLIN